LQARIIEFTDRKEFFEGKIEVIIPQTMVDHEMNALVRQMSQLFKDYVKISRNVPNETIAAFDNIEEPDRKVFYAAANINQSIEIKQNILSKYILKEQYYEIKKIQNSKHHAKLLTFEFCLLTYKNAKSTFSREIREEPG